MDYLLDTHAVIWFLNGDTSLSVPARSAIEDSHDIKHVSAISIWEIAIKIGLGKLEFNGNTKEVVDLIRSNGFLLMQLDIEHILRYEDLELYHRDPFDRLLIAQALSEGFPIISKDKNFDAYPVRRIW